MVDEADCQHLLVRGKQAEPDNACTPNQPARLRQASQLAPFAWGCMRSFKGSQQISDTCQLSELRRSFQHSGTAQVSEDVACISGHISGYRAGTHFRTQLSTRFGTQISGHMYISFRAQFRTHYIQVWKHHSISTSSMAVCWFIGHA